MSNRSENSLKLFGSYPFDSDESYKVPHTYRKNILTSHLLKEGLASILAGATNSNASPGLQEELVRRTKVFYFNRYGSHCLRTSLIHHMPKNNR